MTPEPPPYMLPRLHGRLADIERAVAKHYGIPVRRLHNGGREFHIVWPRQVAMWLMRRYASESEIGRWYGKDHGSVANAARRVTEACQCYGRVRVELARLRLQVMRESGEDRGV